MNRGKYIPKIIKHYGVVYETERGWRCEVNLISWNGNPPRLDIKEWDEDRKNCRKVSTFKPEAAPRLYDLIGMYIEDLRA